MNNPNKKTKNIIVLLVCLFLVAFTIKEILAQYRFNVLNNNQLIIIKELNEIKIKEEKNSESLMNFKEDIFAIQNFGLRKDGSGTNSDNEAFKMLNVTSPLRIIDFNLKESTVSVKDVTVYEPVESDGFIYVKSKYKITEPLAKVEINLLKEPFYYKFKSDVKIIMFENGKKLTFY